MFHQSGPYGVLSAIGRYAHFLAPYLHFSIRKVLDGRQRFMFIIIAIGRHAYNSLNVLTSSNSHYATLLREE